MDNNSESNQNSRLIKTNLIRRLLIFFYTVVLIIALTPFLLLFFINFQDDESVIHIPTIESFVAKKLDQKINAIKLNIDYIGLAKGQGLLTPKVVFFNVDIRESNGARILKLPKVSADLDIFTGISISKNSSKIILENAKLFVLRDAFDKFNLSISDKKVPDSFLKNLNTSIDGFFKLPIAKNIQEISAVDIEVNYLDAKTEKTTYFQSGNLNLKLKNDKLSLHTSFELNRGEKTKSFVNLSGNRTLGASTSDVSIKVNNADPVTLADQIPALDWLRNIDANLNAKIITKIGADTKVLDIKGSLELGEGKLHATPMNSSSKFQYAKADFRYNQNADILNFSKFEFKSDQIVVNGSATNKLIRDLSLGVVGSQTELTIKSLELNMPEFFKKEMHFKNGLAEIKFTMNPFQIKLEKSKIFQGKNYIKSSGDLYALNDYWESRFKLNINKLNSQEVKKYWPVLYGPNARNWVVKNFHEGNISDLNGTFLRASGKSKVNVNFKFDDVTLNLVDTVKPLRNASGYGSLSQSQITLNLDRGTIEPVKGELVDLKNSSFHISNTKSKPVIGKIKLSAIGSLKSVLEVLDSPKFKYITKSGIKSNIATANIEVDGWIELPLVKGIKVDQIKYKLLGTMANVKSKKLIKNHILKSDKVSIRFSDESLTLFGLGDIDNIPVDFKWRQQLKLNPTKISTLNAKLNIDQEFLNVFNIALPPNTFSGSTSANMKIEMKAKDIPTFLLLSNLEGANLKIGSLSWSKDKASRGELKVRGAFAKPLDVNAIELSVNGLEAKGRVNLSENGEFKSVVFPTFNIEDWLSTSIILSKLNNTELIQISGGKIDLRELDLGQELSESSGILDVTLDSLRISDSLELTNFSANINRNDQFTGTFQAKINGGAPITGDLSKGTYGIKINIQGEDAGHVLRSAGVLDNIRGGMLKLELEPAQRNGYYTGGFVIDKLHMLHSNPIASILDSLSLIGLLNKLENEGIQFHQAKGWLNITPEGIQLRDVSLIGLSMGLSLNGWYAKNTKTVDFEGVITPIYAINGVFERIAGKLFGEQKGEGLFSFVYTMKGPTDAPKVRVQPLSILTPGAFRKLFRSDIPEPKK